MFAIPFTNMAVSLSGGGYRATTFHLGSLSYLDSRHYIDGPLLERVKIISTISGGTLTGVMYALKLAQGQTFNDCFEKLYRLLEEDRLVDLALDKLCHPQTWKDNYKTRDMINAFSEVYHEKFFDEQTFAILYDGTKTHLENAIFGTSEFSSGKQFRMQKVIKAGKFGNHDYFIDQDVAREIRLADAAAASSCFPGGFEPMIMPTDFGNGSDSKIVQKWNEKNYQTTAIMDGGVIDNQGIEGVKLTEARNTRGMFGADGDVGSSKQDFIGTYIISDVTSRTMDPLVLPKMSRSSWLSFLSTRRINIFSILCILGIIAYHLLGFESEFGVIITTVLLTIFSMWLIVFGWLAKEVKNTIIQMFGTKESPELLKHLKVINRTPLPVLFYLAKLRATSVMKMVSDVFLKRIRSLQLDALYGSEDWRYRIQSNNIYTLERDLSLPEQMKKVIKHANSMPTTLWFSEKEKNAGMLDDLIACGQFTMCYNLLSYINNFRLSNQHKQVWDGLTKAQQKAIDQLEIDLNEDWNRFKSDPYYLLKMYKDQIKLKG